MIDLIHKIKTLFKLGTLVSSDTSENLKKGDLSFLGSKIAGVVFSPYGIQSHPPDGSVVMSFSKNGNESNQIAIAVNVKDMVPGAPDTDVIIGNPKGKTFIHYKANGEMEIVSPVKVTVTAPEVECTGNVLIKGNLTVEGATALSATVTSNGTDISDTHTHIGSPTAPTGAISPTGAPT